MRDSRQSANQMDVRAVWIATLLLVVFFLLSACAEQGRAPYRVRVSLTSAATDSASATVFNHTIDHVYTIRQPTTLDQQNDVRHSGQYRAYQTAANRNRMRYHEIIVEAAKRYHIDPALVKAVIMAESDFNPWAVSRVGAQGLMQLMPGTAESLGVKDAFNPAHNIFGGAKYLGQLMNRFDGDIHLALAAYNAGPRNVLKYNGIPPFSATRHYIDKVLKYYQIFNALTGYA